jgi:type I restriction-modification system DNA methylase subunit
MPKTTKRSSSYKSNCATLGFEEKLWAAADNLRAHMDAAEYKHVVMGLIFLKYICMTAWYFFSASLPTQKLRCVIDGFQEICLGEP